MKRSRKGVARTSHRNRPKHTVQKENFEYNFKARARAGPSDRKLIQKIIESGSEASYKKGSILFMQGVKPSGIFLVLEGAIKLYIASSEGKSLVLGFVRSGTILGLAATILGRRHETTAQATNSTAVIFLRREALLRFLRENTDAALGAAELLSDRCFKLLDQLKTFNLSESAEQRLAALLLRFHDRGQEKSSSIRLPGGKREDLAQMAGLCRETTSRIISRFRQKQILDWDHGTLVVQNWGALQKLAVLPRLSQPREI